MKVNSQAQLVLDMISKAEAEGAPVTGQASPAELRLHFKNTRGGVTPEVPEVENCEDILVGASGGEIPVRYYRPIGAPIDKKLPIVVYYHGGGWVVGDRDTHDVVCRMLTNRGKFAVLNVDYRLAPENKFPSAVEDAWDVIEWTMGGASGLAIDRNNISVCGDSAGGNLAAVMAIMARDANVSLCSQALIYPATSFHMCTKSQEKYCSGYLLTRDAQTWYHKQYLRSKADYDDWRASPLLADNLANVASAYVLTCGYDPLVDEGREYAKKLQLAGVDVEYRCYEAQIHGFITMGRVVDEANEAVYEVADYIAKTFLE